MVRGVITDEKNNPLAFATVYVKNTTHGTTSNTDGKYTLDIAPGNYELVFQYLGYSKQIKEVNIADKPVTLNIQLLPESVKLNEVVVSSNGEDPAYAIIRNAQKKRKYYLDQVNAYSCDVYIKGIQRLDAIPKSIMGVNLNKQGLDSSILGIVYLSESESQYNFQKPDNIKEVMYSSKVSGNNKAFSFNQAKDFQFNFYDDLVNEFAISNRGFVSPISGSALLYYNYKLVGTFFDGDIKVNKIQVIPKREHDPVFHGTIYIVDKSWRIYSANLMLTKDANIDFVDTLQIKQTFAPVNDTVWMPISQNLSFRFGALGIKGNGSFTGIFKNYVIDPVFPDHFFRNEELKVADEANTKDTSYWSTVRPIPLTLEEKKDYERKDSVSQIRDSRRYKDSIDKIRNRLEPADILEGYDYYRSADKFGVHFSSIVVHTNFNTVEGLNLQENISLNKYFENHEYYNIEGIVRYGFSDDLLSAKIIGKWLVDPVRQGSWGAGGGRFVQQINSEEPISEIINTAYSLFGVQNYMKLYDNSYVYIEHERELTNGLNVSANFSYSDRLPLFNTTNYDWVSAKTEGYTPNTPENLNNYVSITHNTALLLKLTATIHFKQQYVSLPHQKIVTGSKYPVLVFNYIKGIPAFGTNANYDLLEAGLKGDFKFGLLGTSQLSIKAGDFLDKTNLSFIDYAHFMGNQTFFATNYLEGFQLLPYYEYSTDKEFLEAHYEHHFYGFITNKIPLLRKLKLQEVAGIHLLETPDIRYAELSVGIEHIFKLFRIDWVNSYSNTLRLKSGFVIGLSSLFGGS